MATIIDLGDGSFIAGDPPTELDLGQHWCDSCGGSGLGYDWDDTLTTCGGCCGTCVRDCDDTACPTHSTLHPLTTEEPTMATTLCTAWCVDGNHDSCDGEVVIARDGVPFAQADRERCACDCHTVVVACPHTDHDGARIPVTRHVVAEFDAEIALDVARCTYCTEGVVARLLRDGFTVTITPLEAA